MVEQLNFYCVDKVWLGLIGATFLLGIVFGCLTVARLGDKLGRKPVYFAGLFIQGVCSISVVFSTNFLIDYFCLFLVGISVTMRYYIGYTYNVEMQPRSHQNFAGVMLFACEAIVFIFICCYFMNISKYWTPLMIPNIVLTTIGLIFLYNMPESPRFLVSTHKFEKARQVFKLMARWNGKDPDLVDTFVFHEEHLNE